MKHSSIRLSMFGLAAVIVALWPARPGLAADTFRAGDPFVVAQPGAPLMRGSQTLAKLSQGQRLNVIKTEGDWLGTSAVVNGQKVSGWVHRRQAATPSQYAQRTTVRRSFSYQPGAVVGGSTYSGGGYSRGGYSRSSSGGRFIMGQGPYGPPGYWRADRKIVGY